MSKTSVHLRYQRRFAIFSGLWAAQGSLRILLSCISPAGSNAGPIMAHPVGLIRRVVVLNEHKTGISLQRITRDFQGRLRVGLQRAMSIFVKEHNTHSSCAMR